MTATHTVKVEFDDQVVERRWSDANERFDWTPFPVGYGVLLNERYQFPMDMALVRAKVDTSRQLFVDNHLIAHLHGVRRQTHPAEDHAGNPIFAPYVQYPSYICPDPEGGWRLYYNSAGWLLHVARSEDGLNWHIPELNLVTGWGEPERFPGGPNNVVLSGEIHGLFYEPDDPDTDRRWKAIIRAVRGEGRRHLPWPYLPQRVRRGGVPYDLYVSPDGYRWSFEAETNHWQGPSPDFMAPDLPIYGGSDCLRTRWDPKLGKYIGNTKHRIGPDLRCTPVFHAARVVGQVESDDLIHWSSPRIIAYPDGEDVKSPRRGMHGIYEADGYFYESMWLNNFCMCTWPMATKEEARLKAMSKTRQYIKRNWLRLAASRDGRHWYYFGDRKPFINYGDLDSWKPAYLRAVNLATTGGPIVHDDELLYYYRGSSVKAEPPARSALGLARLRRDGFASLSADEDGGLVITRPLAFEGRGNLFVNARPYHDGFLRVSVVDEDTAEPLKGFSEQESVSCTVDSTRAAVRWRQNDTLAVFKQQKRYVRLAFHLRKAALYSFWIE